MYPFLLYFQFIEGQGFKINSNNSLKSVCLKMSIFTTNLLDLPKVSFPFLRCQPLYSFQRTHSLFQHALCYSFMYDCIHVSHHLYEFCLGSGWCLVFNNIVLFPQLICLILSVFFNTST